MEQLDEIVMGALKDRLLTPAHLKQALKALAKRLTDGQGKEAEREKELAREMRQVDKAIERLLEAVEKGRIENEESFRHRMSKNRQRTSWSV